MWGRSWRKGSLGRAYESPEEGLSPAAEAGALAQMPAPFVAEWEAVVLDRKLRQVRWLAMVDDGSMSECVVVINTRRR
jgi:hypothetical protein